MTASISDAVKTLQRGERGNLEQLQHKDYLTHVGRNVSLIRQKCVRNVPDQTKVRSKRPLIRLKCARKPPLIRLVCARKPPDQTSVRSKLSLIRLVCARNCRWSDRPRPKWPLIRQVPDHCPGESALEAFSGPCNSSAPGTCVRSKLVWSGFTSVWPPRPGLSCLIYLVWSRLILFEPNLSCLSQSISE